jgi:hypothetical protein
VGEAPENNVHASVAELRDPANGTAFKHEARISSLAWSPAAASQVNSCLLATVDTASQVTFLLSVM